MAGAGGEVGVGDVGPVGTAEPARQAPEQKSTSMQKPDCNVLKMEEPTLSIRSHFCPSGASVISILQRKYLIRICSSGLLSTH